MNLAKLSSLWALFRQGQAVADPAKWKAHQITGTLIGLLILTAVNAAKAFGYDIPIDSDTANQIGAGVIAVANVVLTVTTSKHAGLPAAIVGDDAARSEQQTARECVNAGQLPAGGDADQRRGADYIN